MIRQKERWLTVVMRVTDSETSKELRHRLSASFSGEMDLPGLTVTGMSVYDEMSRVEYLESLLDAQGIEYDPPKP